MPFKSPDHYELDTTDSTPLSLPLNDDAADRQYDDSDSSDIDDLDPLKPYDDHASQPLRSAYDREKSVAHRQIPFAWLRQGRKHRTSPRRLVTSGLCCVFIALVFAALAFLFGKADFWKQKENIRKHEHYGKSEPWYPTPNGGTDKAWEESYRKAADLVKQMTLVEKVNITTGIGWSMGMCVGNTGPVDRLGFPSLCLQDGPLGLRFVDNATAFPAGITVGATWNKYLMYLRGRAHGFEAWKKGVNVLLGPSMGPIARLPAGGRNWEGFGPDPVLQGIAAAETIKGIQSMGVIATAKHYVANEQEHFRQARKWGKMEAISSNIDDRTLHEIYAWPFADSVRAGVGSVMCSYNQVNDSYACQNSKLLNGVLKDELGFQGFVQSDWLAQRSGVGSALAGLDMTMPGDGLGWQDGESLWGRELTRAVLNSSVPIDRFNDMALRIVAAWYQLGQDNHTRWPNLADGGGPTFSSWTDEEIGLLHPGSPNADETGVVNKFVPVRITKEDGNHDQLARRIAAESVVLVKNEDGILPLSRAGEGILSQSGGKIKVGFFGEDGFLNPNGSNSCPDRGCNEGTLAMGWGSGAVELPHLSEPASALRSAFDDQLVEFVEVRSNTDSQTGSIAAEQGLCFVFVNSDAGEGYLSWSDVDGDRNDLFPQKDGDELVRTVAASCGGSTIVVLHTVGPTILERWIDTPGVKAVLIAHLPGQESGNSLADVVFGYYNPSGRLPYTIAKREEDYGPSSGILFSSDEEVPQQNFSEGLYFDYRYFDKHDIQPRFEFGYGLSYTSFRLSAVVINSTGLNGTLPAQRDFYGLRPPNIGHHLPDPSEVLTPKGFRKLRKYIYPYLDAVDDVKVGQYDWPQGYETWHPPASAGGGQGGNPDLYSTAAIISVNVTNAGNVAGDCVVQLYVSHPDNITGADGKSVDMPVRVLRMFDKIWLGTARNESTKQIDFKLTRRDMSYWDVSLQNWVMPLGNFSICLGFSSRDLPECHPWENKLTSTIVPEEPDGKGNNTVA